MVRNLMCAVVLAILFPVLAGCNNSSGSRSNAIVFVRENLSGDMEVWMMRPDGTDKVLVASRPGNNVLQGQLSPDGRTLLYLTNVGLTEMVTQDLSTWALTVLITSPDGNNDMTPAYSPDGMKIAYSLSDDRDIHLMDADGMNQVTIASDASVDYIFPNWNVDGTRIVYMRGWTDGDIWTMDPDGNGQTLVKATDANFGYRHPSFLPNGRIICCRSDYANDSQLDIVVMDADGSNETNLTPGTLDTDEFFPSANDKGKKIIFATQDHADSGDLFRDIYVGDFNGSALSNLTNLTADTDDRCWRPKFGHLDESYLLLP